MAWGRAAVWAGLGVRCEGEIGRDRDTDEIDSGKGGLVRWHGVKMNQKLHGVRARTKNPSRKHVKSPGTCENYTSQIQPIPSQAEKPPATKKFRTDTSALNYAHSGLITVSRFSFKIAAMHNGSSTLPMAARLSRSTRAVAITWCSGLVFALST